MEKNSDELVSFEDYEDLSPEEKLEIERQVYIERQLADGVNPDEVDREVPEEYIPEELFEECTNLTDIYVPWAEGTVNNAPWGATNATVHYNHQV